MTPFLPQFSLFSSSFSSKRGRKIDISLLVIRLPFVFPWRNTGKKERDNGEVLVKKNIFVSLRVVPRVGSPVGDELSE